ncbi:MAG: patatin-like phospholipase family protein [Phaeodactylibacter sp.]|uniref:patatin-like phospholipase family protein n=1 Tax=Phaeodactylibacter sp. TaxID=1940289 RepID=UPI0032EB31B9
MVFATKKEDVYLLQKGLSEIFGEFDQALLDYLKPHIQWVKLHGSDYLFQQGDEGDAVFFLVRGRLLALRSTSCEETPNEVLGEVASGEVVGEIAVHSEEPRMASVLAIRDSVLIKVSAEAYFQTLHRFPQLGHRITKRIIKRLRRDDERQNQVKRPATLFLLALHQHEDFEAYLGQLQGALEKVGDVEVITEDMVRQALGTNSEESLDLASERVGHWLDEQEAAHDFLLYTGKPDRKDWILRCMRQSDQILLWAHFSADFALTPLEQQMEAAFSSSMAPKILVLQHPVGAPFPRGTVRWLDQRPWLDRHFHIRQDNPRDIPRLARSICGSAIGLTLAGGGAKGFAHIGVYRALQEQNVPVDIVGGTSAGAMLAAVISFDRNYEQTDKCLKRAALHNPTKDLNLLPLISLIKGRRFRDMISQAIECLTGYPDVDLADSWIPLHVVVSNLSKAREEVFTRGSAVRLLTASGAVPGVFPPVPLGDDLLVDGGNFNNFPVDVMRKMGAGSVIGVDFLLSKDYKLDFDEAPSSWQVLKDKFRRKNKKYKMPSMTSIITKSSLLYSTARRKETIQYLDVHFNPNVQRFGFASWKAYEHIRDEGYHHAIEILNALPPEELKALQTADSAKQE